MRLILILMICSTIQALLQNQNSIQYEREQENKRQRIYDLLNAETKPKFLCIQGKEINRIVAV